VERRSLDEAICHEHRKERCPPEGVARAHQDLIWDRTRQVLRLRAALREFFPAALQAFDDLTAGDALELLDRAPDSDRAARLSRLSIVAALRRGGRRNFHPGHPLLCRHSLR
jgi:hypothetical protein